MVGRTLFHYIHDFRHLNTPSPRQFHRTPRRWQSRDWIVPQIPFLSKFIIPVFPTVDGEGGGGLEGGGPGAAPCLCLDKIRRAGPISLHLRPFQGTVVAVFFFSVSSADFSGAEVFGSRFPPSKVSVTRRKYSKLSCFGRFLRFDKSRRFSRPVLTAFLGLPKASCIYRRDKRWIWRSLREDLTIHDSKTVAPVAFDSELISTWDLRMALVLNFFELLEYNIL